MVKTSHVTLEEEEEFKVKVEIVSCEVLRNQNIFTSRLQLHHDPMKENCCLPRKNGPEQK